MTTARIISASLCIALIFPGCAATPPPEANLPPTPAAFREAPARVDVAARLAEQENGRWWTIFNDPVLDGLIERAEQGNTGVQEAAARLAQAQAQVRMADAAQRPQLGAGTSATYQAGPLINAAGAAGSLFNLGANLSYEVDFLGRLSKAGDAARLDAESRQALLRSVRLLTEASIAQAYFAIRELDDERALLQDTANGHRETLRLMQGRQRAGLTTELSVVRARAELGTIESDALVLDRRRAELEHSLAFLIGEPAPTFRLDNPTAIAPLPIVPAGIPSSVLARRPDVAATERSMEAARVRLGLAETAWLPNFDLTASGGFASADLAKLLAASASSFGAGAILALPLFDGGRRKAGIQSAAADLDLAYAADREQILTAFRDVEDELSALRLLADQADVLKSTVDAEARATALLESRRANGLASTLDVLHAHRVELKDRRASLQVQSARYIATVGLVRALGGGWDDVAADTRNAPANRSAQNDR